MTITPPSLIARALSVAGIVFAAQAQVGQPRLGCYSTPEGAFEIVGVAGSAIVRPAEACAQIASPWHVDVDPDGETWIEKRDDLTAAVQSRTRLEPGRWAVFADGTPVNFDTLELPGAVSAWQLVAGDWMLIRAGDAAILLHARLLHAGTPWFYLPAAPVTPAKDASGATP